MPLVDLETKVIFLSCLLVWLHLTQDFSIARFEESMFGEFQFTVVNVDYSPYGITTK